MSHEVFPPAKAPSAYDGDYQPRHARKGVDLDSIAIGCGVVAVIVLGLFFIYFLALVVIG